MSHKRKGQLTVSGEWAKHLRPYLRRLFWKAERKADRAFVRTETISVEKVREDSGTVEELLAEVQALSSGIAAIELWVPENLTFQGREIPSDVAMAIVVDRLLEHGLYPNGFVAGRGGRLYRYSIQ